MKHIHLIFLPLGWACNYTITHLSHVKPKRQLMAHNMKCHLANTFLILICTALVKVRVCVCVLGRWYGCVWGERESKQHTYIIFCTDTKGINTVKTERLAFEAVVIPNLSVSHATPGMLEVGTKTLLLLELPLSGYFLPPSPKTTWE